MMQKHSVSPSSRRQVHCMWGYAQYLHSSVKVTWFISSLWAVDACHSRITSILFFIYPSVLAGKHQVLLSPSGWRYLSRILIYDSGLSTYMIYWQLSLTHNLNAGRRSKGLAMSDKRRRLYFTFLSAWLNKLRFGLGFSARGAWTERPDQAWQKKTALE